MSTGNHPGGASDGQPEPVGGEHPGTPSFSAQKPAPAPSRMPGSGAAPVPETDPTPRAGAAAPADQPGVTRAGVVWAAVVASLILLILLIIFILQNQDQVAVRYFALEGFVPLGMALFIASVSGGVLVAVAGGARILQLRRNAHRRRSAARK